jgi:NAD(P)-dependent dehydrogenase (short-subunit alcohol dehydrogenase family)
MHNSCTLLTGASSAIGRAIAVRLSQSRRLILHGRNVIKLTDLRETCLRPETHHLWPYDLTDTAGMSASLGAFLAEQRLVVEAFVHCAGMLRLGAFRLVTHAVETEIFTVNLFSAVEILRLLRHSEPNRGTLSNVIMISSGASLFGEKGNVIYSASKGAIDAFMKSLAVEMAPEGRANSILPGMIDGGMSDLSRQSAGYAEVIKTNYPLGIGHAADVAGLTEFLLSENARWITGQQILVDGGYSSHCGHVP